VTGPRRRGRLTSVPAGERWRPRPCSPFTL
jgi:hypothetical protein